MRRIHCLIIFSLTLLHPLLAEAFDFGTVQSVEGKVVQVAPTRSTSVVVPLTLAKFQTKIEGVDDALESGKGYVTGRRDNMLLVEVTEGDPQPGDSLILVPKFFGSDSPTRSVEHWSKMALRDLEIGHAEGFIGATCALAGWYENGSGGVAQDLETAFDTYYQASKNPDIEPECAYHFARIAHNGFTAKVSGKIEKDPEMALQWSEFAARSGKASHQIFYAEVLASEGRFKDAEAALQRVITSGVASEVALAKKALSSLEQVRKK